MKKYFYIFAFLLFSITNIFAQTNTSINLDDDVYKILDYAELKGWIDPLPANKALYITGNS